LGKLLGEGSSGCVRLAKHSKTGKPAAVKIMKKNNKHMSTSSLQEAGYDLAQAMEREIMIMNLLRHPNITQIYGIWESETSL
jgi:serine/threonine-protein kinase HSL1, negative regulator of Swe1 kinase